MILKYQKILFIKSHISDKVIAKQVNIQVCELTKTFQKVHSTKHTFT